MVEVVGFAGLGEVEGLFGDEGWDILVFGAILGSVRGFAGHLGQLPLKCQKIVDGKFNYR